MRFYYFSLFSWVIIVSVCIAAIGAFWVVWAIALKRKYSHRVFWISTAVIFVLPWTEELWIAWQFGQLCRKDAGVFVNKTVEVEGFYDDTGAPNRLVGASVESFRFVEGNDGNGKYRRVERASPEEKAAALAWYAETNPRKSPKKDEWISRPIDERVRVVVETNTGFAWRITTLDRPTARYHYKMDSGARAGYKIIRQESLVLDSQSGEVLGRYAQYGRDAPWLYIGLGRPPYACDGPDGGPNTKHSFLIYREILKPSK